MDNLGGVKKIFLANPTSGEKQNRNMPDLKVTGWQRENPGTDKI